MGTASFGEVDLEPCSILRLVVLWALELDDSVEHILPLRGAPGITAAGRVRDEQDGLAHSPQLQQPSLHLIPAISVILAAAVNKGRDIVEDQEIDLIQQCLNRFLVIG